MSHEGEHAALILIINLVPTRDTTVRHVLFNSISFVVNPYSLYCFRFALPLSILGSVCTIQQADIRLVHHTLPDVPGPLSYQQGTYLLLTLHLRK